MSSQLMSNAGGSSMNFLNSCSNRILCCMANLTATFPDELAWTNFIAVHEDFFKIPEGQSRQITCIRPGWYHLYCTAYVIKSGYGNIYMDLNGTELVAATNPNDCRSAEYDKYLNAGDLFSMRIQNGYQFCKLRIEWIIDKNL